MRFVRFAWRNLRPKMSWVYVPANTPFTESASLNGWRCERFVPSATCPSYSWHNCTATRSMDLRKGLCLVQKTLYSLHTTPYGSPKPEATDLMSPSCPLGNAPRILAGSGLRCAPLMTWICGLHSNQSTFRCLPWAEETQATREDGSSVWPWTKHFTIPN